MSAAATAGGAPAQPDAIAEAPRAPMTPSTPPQAGSGAAVSMAWRMAFASPLYRLTLAGPVPREFRRIPRDPWPGESAHGEELRRAEAEMREALRFAGGAGEPARQAWLHGFRWLRDLRALGGDEARRQARELVAAWIAEHDRWSEIAWRPDVLGARLVAWLGNHDFFAASADDRFRAGLRRSITRQARHLVRTVRRAPAGAARIAAIHGLLVSGAALPDGDRRMAAAVRLLERELPGQILGDGGHVERSPSVHLEVLRRLVEIRTLLRAAGMAAPEILGASIERMAPMLRFFRHGDGGLALFNDSNEEEGWAVDLALTQADAKGRPGASAPDSGFERLVANRTLVLMDVGAPPPPGLDGHAHAGTLSFEMSVGKERLIVNCGAHAGGRAAWRQVQRSTAAHSAASIADSSSAEILPDGRLGRRPSAVTAARQSDSGNSWVEASHDGYCDTHGIRHTRRVYLAAGGDDFRGADSFAGAAGRAFTLRFHLHPDVKPLMVHDDSAVLLRLPSGASWRLRAAGGRLSLAESVYLGERGVVRRCEQVVIEGVTGAEETQVRWAFQALPKR